MIYKNGERMRDFLGLFVFIVVQLTIFWGVFNKTIIPLALVGYEMIFVIVIVIVIFFISQLGATPLVGYLSSHVQRALME